MCSVLIFIKPDNEHDDPRFDWQKFKAGDVIDVQWKDKFEWGADIQGPDALGWWAVVVVPGAAVADVEHLLESGPMPFASLNEQSRAEVPHQKRLRSVDVSRLAPTMLLAEFLAIAFEKPPMVNYNVIG